MSSTSASGSNGMMTTAGHLTVLRRMFVRIVAVAAVIAVVVFCFKEETFQILLAPKSSDFVTFKWIEGLMSSIDSNFHFDPYNVKLISTELSAQFMLHLSTTCYLALLLASPYIVFELFRFISPALYDNERRYSIPVALIIYVLFVMGLLMSYFILFPVSFRFLATYQVSPDIENTITLDSYISTFVTLSFVMGIVFQLPVIAYFLGKMGIIDSYLLRRYRRWTILIIALLSAIITPPDLFTLVLVAVPMYALYEISIRIVPKGDSDTIPGE